MPEGKVDHPRRRPEVSQQERTGLRVHQGPRRGPPQREPGAFRGQPPFSVGRSRDDVSDAVGPALVPLRDVVEERGTDQVRVVVAAFEQPLRGARGVNDVARVLGKKQLEQLRREPLPGELKVRLSRPAPGVEELPRAVPHQTSRLKSESARPPIRNQIGLKPVKKPTTNMVIKIPKP